MTINQIGLAKAILWEEAKGKLRAMVAAGGHANSTDGTYEKWEECEKVVEKFIKKFEDDGFHE